MCGIVGIFDTRSRRDIDEGLLASMNQALFHRGPDEGGMHREPGVGLGHRRLSIIDLSTGQQPLFNEDGSVVVVFNGEIYNFQALCKELIAHGHTFRTHSDTEVIVHAWEQWGERCVERFRGMFAFALWDRNQETLFIARDRLGKKPLYYAALPDGQFIFASELKALLASGMIPRRVDSESLQQLLSLGSVYQPKTLVDGVLSLPPAHYMWVDRSGIRLQRYWSFGLDRVAGLRQLPYSEQVDQFSTALTESVSLQMVADVPVGAFLSGGVDSSLIVALMAREAGGHIKTFSVGFEEGAGTADESHEAAAIARLLETDHTRVLVTADDMVAHLDRFIVGLDQPSVDGFNSYFVSYAASQGVTVSLSGTGGDELFLGYPWFANVKNTVEGAYPNPSGSRLQRLGGRLPFLNRLVRARSSTSPDPEEFREIFGRQYHCFGPSIAHDLLSFNKKSQIQPRSFADDLVLCDEFPDWDLLDRTSVLCLNGYTRNQLLRDIDACSMAHSLEVRVPFLDVGIADFAFSLPVASKLAMNERTLDPTASYTQSGVKKIVCDVARKYLPANFFDARAKRGFSLPFEDCLRGPLAEVLADTLSRESVAKAGLFDPAAVEKIHKDFLVGRRPWSHPWLLMVIELWRRQVLLP